MPFYPVRNDITRMKVDAIVNAANQSLLGGGGVDGAIHRAAGHKLLEECKKLNGCSTGQAKITRGYDLPAKYIIHTVGPVYKDGMHGEELLLRSCYKNSLLTAAKKGLESIAFPLISAGAYGYPREEAIRIASEEIVSFLESHEMTVYLVFYDKSSFTLGKERFPDLESKIEENQVRLGRRDRRERLMEEETAGSAPHFGYSIGSGIEENIPPLEMARERLRRAADKKTDAGVKFSTDIEPQKPAGKAFKEKALKAITLEENAPERGSSLHRLSGPSFSTRGLYTSQGMPSTLEDALRNRDESFAQMLFRCIDASGMTDPECYHKANIDKKLFSKIRSKADYQPSKPTVLAFAVALELDIKQTEELLKRAGLAFNGSDTFDIIVEYFINKKKFDIHGINLVLFQYDQPLLGNCARD